MSEQEFKLVKAKELAVMLGVPVSWIYEQTRKGKLRHYRPGKYKRYNPAEVIEDLRAKGNQDDSSSKTE